MSSCCHLEVPLDTLMVDQIRKIIIPMDMPKLIIHQKQQAPMKKIFFFSLIMLLNVANFQTAQAFKNTPQQSEANKEYLSRPEGKYSVSFKDFHWINNHRCPDDFYIKGKNETDFSKENQSKFCREIMTRIYYPSAEKLSNQKRVYYYSPMIKAQENFIDNLNIPNLSRKEINTLSEIKSFTMENKSYVKNKSFPILLFNPGYGCDFQIYENILTDIVSHGYIVIAINNTFISQAIQFPDGRTVKIASDVDLSIKQEDDSVLSDIVFVRNKIKFLKIHEPILSAISTARIGVFGHSIGGFSIVEAIRKQPHLFDVAALLDAIPVTFGTRMYSPNEMKGFEIPVMRLFSAEWRSFDTFSTPREAQFILNANNFNVLLSPNMQDTTYTRHNSFTDLSTLQYHPVSEKFTEYQKEQCHKNLTQQCPKDPGGVGTANGWHERKVINKYLIQFFDIYLKNKSDLDLEKCRRISKDTILSCGKFIN